MFRATNRGVSVKTIKVIEKIECCSGKQEECPEEVCRGEDIFSVLDMRYIDGDSSYSIIRDKDNIVILAYLISSLLNRI